MNEKKRKQKQYYVKQAKRAKFEKRKLHPGLRGFLCTTNNKERECVREAYNLLNEFANQMYGEEHDAQGSAGGSGAPDVEQSLEAELAALKEEHVSRERRFQQVESGAKNCIFISTQLERTAPLVERIAQEVRESGTQRTRYLLRLLPVQVTCKATEADIRASAESMIKEAFTELGVTYTTVFRSRNQAQLKQSDAQTAINDLIEAVCPTARLNHKTPRLTVVMEVIRNVICLGVVRDYFEMRKYNLVELAKGGATEGGEGENGGRDGEETEEGSKHDEKEEPSAVVGSEGQDCGDGALKDSADAKGESLSDAKDEPCAVEGSEGQDCGEEASRDSTEGGAVVEDAAAGTDECSATAAGSSGAAAPEITAEPPSSGDGGPETAEKRTDGVAAAGSAADTGTGTEDGGAGAEPATDAPSAERAAACPEDAET